MPDVRSMETTLEALVTRADPTFYRSRAWELEYVFSNGVEKYANRSDRWPYGSTVVDYLLDHNGDPIEDDAGFGIEPS